MDRSRILADKLLAGDSVRPFYREEIPEVHQRVLLIGRALVCFYLAAGCFAIATLASITGAVIAELVQNAGSRTLITGALAIGLVGFCAFIAGALLLVIESRTAVRSLSREYNEVISLLARKEI